MSDSGTPDCDPADQADYDPGAGYDPAPPAPDPGDYVPADPGSGGP